MGFDQLEALITALMQSGVENGATEALLGAATNLQAVLGTLPQYMQNFPWLAILPPIIAIVLALITKEVYSSLFIGILAGGALFAGFNFMGTAKHVFVDGIVGSLSDSWNVGILVFDVLLGAIIMLMNRAGGAAAFGRWAKKTVKTKVGAEVATIILGMLIFIDDYFNCLTVGTVMRPVTDEHKISRAKLAYLIDATAAPICIIAPVSSWAAAVVGFVDGADGLNLFLRAIPYNFYAFLTITMMFVLALAKFEYGPMKLEELAEKAEQMNAIKPNPSMSEADDQPTPPVSSKGKVMHLVVPIIFLIVACVAGMVYTGGFFEGVSFAEAFADSNASVGLMYGSAATLIFTIIFFLITRVLSFRECMNAVPEGFKAMVPAILILTFAWSLKLMTDSLGCKEFVAFEVALATYNGGKVFLNFIPAFVFLIGCGLSFATGTSWGTFGILIPIVVAVFNADLGNELMIVSISACMAGAVCGDHCSPISDTTIMASAGAQCDHIKHVSTQIPYAVTVAATSLVCYIFTGFIRSWAICLPLSIGLMILVLLVIKKLEADKEAEQQA